MAMSADGSGGSVSDVCSDMMAVRSSACAMDSVRPGSEIDTGPTIGSVWLSRSYAVASAGDVPTLPSPVNGDADAPAAAVT